VGRRFHALWADPADPADPPIPPATDDTCPIQPIRVSGPDHFHVLASTQEHYPQVESLTLQTWAAISGAAVSTGMGSGTSAPLSFLFGLAGVRLGYWWNSGIKYFQRPDVVPPPLLERLARLPYALFPMQSLMLAEFRGLFGGPSRERWYLSDGGHFEDLGLYELIRRRLPLVICCDGGEDGSYTFEDLGELVRKARMDFMADITFYSAEELAGIVHPGVLGLMGTPEQIAQSCKRFKKDKPTPSRHVALARIEYLDIPEPERAQHLSWILYIKASLSGDEPRDVATYAKLHDAFPHESTGDQVFDEAQWESYRKLGETIGDSLFNSSPPVPTPAAPIPAGTWLPCMMVRPVDKAL
jgi:hypothetical protein